MSKPGHSSKKTEHEEQFITWLIRKGIAPSSTAIYLTGMRHYLQFLQEIESHEYSA